MVDGGYVWKRIASRPDWLGAAGVLDICSVSNCVSAPADGWIEHWQHNDFGWYNTIAAATSVVPRDQRASFRLFAYRLYPEAFTASGRTALVVPADVKPDAIPSAFAVCGFDAVSRSRPDVLGFECSPLSCNSMAEEIPTNQHCLFPTLEAAIAGAERFARVQPEPGDYFIVEVLEHQAPEAA